jgi:hypothetical protein
VINGYVLVARSRRAVPTGAVSSINPFPLPEWRRASPPPSSDMPTKKQKTSGDAEVRGQRHAPDTANALKARAPGML